MKEKRREALLWSIAFPGFGQLRNGHLFKGLLFIVAEFVVNVQSGFNKTIQLSFLGETMSAFEHIEVQWLMFYPCIYFFAMWDAYKDAGGDQTPKYAFLPFVFGAYFVTVGLIYSPLIQIIGIFPGPVFTPMLAVIPGVTLGLIIRSIMLKKDKTV